MTIVQSSYSRAPAEAVLGQLAEAFSPSRRTGKIARGLIKAGYGVFTVPTLGQAGTQMLDPGEVFQIPNPGVAADVDAFVTAITSSTSIQTFSGATLNGVVGTTEMQPARKVTLVLSSHTDWDATNATLIGYDHNGQLQTESLAIPNGGNATVTSANTYRTVTSLAIPAQSGTGGTATVGISALTSGLVAADFRGVSMRQSVKTTLATNGIYGYPGITSNTITADYVDGETLPVLTMGGIWVYAEEAVVDGDPVYVRVAAGAGGSVLGGFRNDDDTSSCVLVPDARFCRNAAALGPAWAYFPHRG